MKRILITLLTLAPMMVLAQSSLERTIALVDYTCITEQDVQNTLPIMIENMGLPAKLPRQVKRQQALTYLTQRHALLNEAKDRGIHISPMMVKRALGARANNPNLAKQAHEDLAIMALQDAALHELGHYPKPSAMEAFLKEHGDEAMRYTLRQWTAPTHSSAIEAKKALLAKQSPLLTASKLLKNVEVMTLPDSFHQALKQRSPKNFIVGPIQTGNGYHILVIEHIGGTFMTEQQAFNHLRNAALKKIWHEWSNQILKHHYIEMVSHDTSTS